MMIIHEVSSSVQLYSAEGSKRACWNPTPFQKVLIFQSNLPLWGEIVGLINATQSINVGASIMQEGLTAILASLNVFSRPFFVRGVRERERVM